MLLCVVGSTKKKEIQILHSPESERDLPDIKFPKKDLVPYKDRRNNASCGGGFLTIIMRLIFRALMGFLVCVFSIAFIKQDTPSSPLIIVF